MQKIFFLIMIVSFALILLNCEKNNDPISSFTDDDTTNNGDIIARKPNIYIYPEEKLSLNINLLFPSGGDIIESIPAYNSGWELEVLPTGVIDSQYTYLYYEARIPNLLQRENGWIVDGSELESFFKDNLETLLFSQDEIGDFLDYWIPRFDRNICYAIYPSYTEELEGVIKLEFSTAPDNLIRVFYLIEEQERCISISPPTVPEVERKGFVVLEWGVVI